MDTGLKSLEESLKSRPSEKKAKNIILFIGDGMGVSTVTASRIYNGQTENLPSEQTPLSFETFPYAGLMKVGAENSTDKIFVCGKTPQIIE